MTIVREGEDSRVPAAARFALMAVADQIDTLADQIFKLERAIVTEAKRDEDMRRLTTIPGVGAITAATIKALVPDPGGFKSARHFAAWVGLTPRPHSSGGKERLGGIPRRQDGGPIMGGHLGVGAVDLRVVEAGPDDKSWHSD